MDNCSDHDYSYLPDDCLKIIFKKLQNIEEKNSFGLASKRWLQIQYSTRESFFINEELSSKNAKEIKKYLPKLIRRYSSLSSVSLNKCLELNNYVLNRCRISGSNIKSLSLDSCYRIFGKCLANVFADCPNVETLSLDWCDVTNRVLKTLAESCKELRELSVSHCEKISDRGITTLLKGCKKLNSLNISHCKQLKGTGFKNCPETLTRLIAEFCSFPTEGLLEIFKAQGLEYLSLANLSTIVQVDEGLTTKRLKVLNLNNCCYLSGDIAIFRSCPLLEELYLSRCRIGFIGLSDVGENCKKLRVINANACHRLTIDGFLDLAEFFKGLEVLHVWNCHRITQDAVEEFRDMRPDVSVITHNDNKEYIDFRY